MKKSILALLTLCCVVIALGNNNIRFRNDSDFAITYIGASDRNHYEVIRDKVTGDEFLVVSKQFYGRGGVAIHKLEKVQEEE